MPLIIALSFFIVFLVAVVLFLAAGGDGGAQQAERSRELLESVVLPIRDSGDSHLDVRKREVFSSIPWLNRRLAKTDLPHQLRLLLVQANLKWTPGRFLLISIAFWAFSWFLIDLRTGAGLFAFVVALGFGTLPLLYVLRKREQQLRTFERLLPEAIGHMVSAIRAGQSLSSALGVVVREVPDPVGREFRLCVDEQNFGLDLSTAMHNLAERVPLPDLQMVVTAILIQKESGGNLAEILDKTAAVLRERFRLQKQIRIHTTQGRMTGWILSILPALLGLLLYLVDPDHMRVLWTRPVGVDLLWAALIMNLTGLWIIRRIVKIRV
jgi:tight adherence protein B